MLHRGSEQGCSDSATTVFKSDCEACHPPSVFVIVEDTAQGSVIQDTRDGVAWYDTGPPGRVVINVCEKSDRDGGGIDLAFSRPNLRR